MDENLTDQSKLVLSVNKSTIFKLIRSLNDCVSSLVSSTKILESVKVKFIKENSDVVNNLTDLIEQSSSEERRRKRIKLTNENDSNLKLSTKLRDKIVLQLLNFKDNIIVYCDRKETKIDELIKENGKSLIILINLEVSLIESDNATDVNQNSDDNLIEIEANLVNGIYIILYIQI